MSQEAFTQLVDAYYAGLYRFALSLARSEADASDLTQQTFYVWATKGHGLRDVAKVKSWLFTTLYREVLRGRRRGERLTSMDTAPVEEVESTQLTPDAIEAADASLVMEALQEVDDAFRAPLTLFYLEDLSYQEIADALEIPIGTVMSRLSRGKNQLRSRLEAKRTPSNVVPFKVSKAKSGNG
jgi:RNA polymerase sigma-70 factor (ECF subfamily)